MIPASKAAPTPPVSRTLRLSEHPLSPRSFPIANASPPLSAPTLREFNRDHFAQRFLSVAARLDAILPRQPLSAAAIGLQRSELAGASRLLSLLDSPEFAYGILRRNEPFRPSEHLSGPAPAVETRESKHKQADTTHPASPRLQRTSSSLNNKKLSSPAIDTTGSIYISVGGKARVLPSDQLDRVKSALRARSDALANIQPNTSTSPELRKALRAAPGSTWEALKNSAAASNNPAGQSISVGSTLLTTGNSESTSKQALISELVERTHFSTQHIFQMSRKFKEIAGAAKSVIAFDEFRQIMGENMSELLSGLDQEETEAETSTPIAPSTTTPELSAIGATIAASDTFLRRLFLAFDSDGDGKIDIREFVVGLNSFAKGTPEQKVAALFEIYRSDSVPVGKGSPRVAISDLLGLFQGDRQLYQELMRCVDDYFVRVELRDENMISEEEFVAVSLEEPHLLDNISRPLPSRRYAADDRVRELVRSYIDHCRLNWRALLGILRALIAWTRANREVSATPFSVSSMVAQDKKPTLDAEFQAIVLPAADFHSALLIAHVNALAADAQPQIDSLVQKLLLAYMAPSSNSNTRSSAKQSAPTGHKVEDSVFVAQVAGSELAQDLAVAMLAGFVADLDLDARARYFFELYDLNGDGFLSRSELSTAVCAGFAHFGRNVMEVVRVLEDEDADQDGELTEAEYLRAAHKSPTILASLYTCL